MSQKFIAQFKSDARKQEQMLKIRKRLGVFYKRHEIDIWLRSPHPQLDHHRPCDLINDGEGALVEQILDRLESGAYL